MSTPEREALTEVFRSVAPTLAASVLNSYWLQDRIRQAKVAGLREAADEHEGENETLFGQWLRVRANALEAGEL